MERLWLLVGILFFVLAMGTVPPVSAADGQVLFINEIMASNRDAIADEDGDFEDWIELYNAGERDIDVTGYYLSDDAEDITRWQFPEGEVPAGGYLLVWASGKDRVGTGGELHTNFRISRDGEPIFFVEPDGETVVDSVEAIPIARTLSYGRLPDGSSNWVFFDADNVTPNRSNNQAEEYLLPSLTRTPVFSHGRGFYTEPFALELETESAEATIYYTLDGSEPHPDHVGGQTYFVAPEYPFGRLNVKTYETFVYTEPIPIPYGSQLSNDLVNIRTAEEWRGPAEQVFQGVTVRAAVYYDDETFGETVTQTYFVDEAMTDRYTLPVVSIVANPRDLFGYERGIYVPGLLYDELYDATLYPWQAPGNYSQRGRDWERPASIEYFEPDGTLGFVQNIGVRIHGGATRTRDRKSLRLYARSEYDQQNRFSYDIFPGLEQYSGSGDLVEDYNRLILRNSGNDSNGTLIRDAIMQALVDPMDIAKQAFSPVVVFINGEYWGLKNVRERLDPHYVESHYGVDSDDVVILYDYHNYDGTAISVGSEQDLQDFVELRTFIDINDMSDPSHYAYVQTQMDIENFLQYYMANIYFKNTDWPHNNNRFWRKDVEKLDPEAPVGHDGRWRWIMFDTDFGFQDPDHDTLRWATRGINERTGERWPNMMLWGLLGNEDFRHRFINAFADAMNTVFAPNYVHSVIDELYNWIAPEIPEHQARWQNGGHYPQFMKDFASARPQQMQQHIVRAFDLPGLSRVTASVNPKEGHIRINSVDIREGTPGITTPMLYRGRYFRGVPVTITAVPAPGYEFAGWQDRPDLEDAAFTTMLDRELRLFAQFRAVED